MPSGGAFAITARISALVTSAAVWGAGGACDDVIACAAMNTTARITGTVFFMAAPCRPPTIRREDRDDDRDASPDLPGAAGRHRRREVGSGSVLLHRRQDVRGGQ